ncbi:phosphate/phosphite/phosphonate ABC transporter substrate-binding protein [Roseibium sediminicola]|uniref:PhnD/SsuA/transferrin family substrate-binding protein n=1 Tax=Roseibium sediminicola TaxID=2933272 RepID=A0ABT0GUY3_9HYPH|nr:PhnD/SsuA/transferrin family substrate-binding protein [Roseibium sp. CAU 1639]MCK7613236.1 PhnD/SsuA/transferrin family substrate-binding protein [Roseibium sp. CAU 1639]
MTGRSYLPVRLPMYDWPEVRDATADLESALQGALSAVLGIEDKAFRERSEEAEIVAVWSDPDVLLTQTCGYPLTHALAGKVRLIGTPHYEAPGCRGPNYCSQLVVRRNSSYRALADLRGRRAAFNSSDSQSGMNTFRHAIARLGRGTVFFSDVIESGGHLNSMKMVAAGDAEIASIDAVSWGLACRECPDLAADLRSIGETASAPGLPLITSLRFSDAEVARIGETVAQVFAAPETAKSRERLGIRGFSKLDVSAYDGILAMERQAAEMGYPALA